MRRSVLLLLAFVFPALVQTAMAQGPGSYARETRFGMVRLDTSFVAPDGCHTILSAGRGAPGNVALGHDIIPVTVVIGRDPAGCSGRQVLRHVMNIGGGSMLDLVQIFFVSPDGRLLKTEKVSVSSAF